MGKIFTKEVKIALAAIAGVVLLFFGMNFLKGITLFNTNVEYKLAFKDAKGLARSTAVFADGYKVGTVRDIEYDYEGNGPIMVHVDIDPDLRIPAGSQAEIVSDLMGNTKVNILLANNPRQRIEEGGVIKGVEDVDAMNQVREMIPVISAMVPKLDSIVTAFNMLVSDPALVNMLHNVELMSENLKESTAGLNVLIGEVNKGVPSLVRHANKTLENTETLTNSLARIDVDGTMAKVNRTLDNVEQLTVALNNREGSLGLLMHDKELYTNLNKTVNDADSLLVDLKSHPKRYVHFSVFGRKDK